MESTENCSVSECTKPLFSIKSGLCRPHYRRLQKYGDFHAGPKIVDRSLSTEERFWASVEPTGFCWTWTGKVQERSGHGRFNPTRQASIAAHRYAYESLVGPIPEGMTLDHLCRNPPCVNPDHTEPVTNRVNVLRGFGITAQQARQTHCKRGHEFTPGNTYVTKRGIRQCRECSRAKNRIANAQQRECRDCGSTMRVTSLYRHMKEVHGEPK